MAALDLLQAKPDAATLDGNARRPRILPPHLLVLGDGTSESGWRDTAESSGPTRPGPAAHAVGPAPGSPAPGAAELAEATFLPHKIRKSDLDQIDSGSFAKWTLAAVFIGVITWAAGLLAREPVSMLAGTCLVAVGILSYTAHRIRVREEIAERKGVWQGTCPHCLGIVVLSKFDALVNCTHCDNPVMRQDGAFSKPTAA